MMAGSAARGPTAAVLPFVTLPGTDVQTTALGFGCAGLYREPIASRRRRILASAHASGIRHFDVAPMYGLGLAERELGQFARGRRDQLVIATKFGIEPTAVARGLARVQAPVRRVFLSFPALRQRARSQAAGPGSGRIGSLVYRASGFDGAGARASLERSLRELRTDHLDLLLLHDPQPGDMRSDEVCAYLERVRDAGVIRAWGIAGEPDSSHRVAELLPIKPPVMQVRDDPLDGCSATASSLGSRITFGVLEEPLARIVAHIVSAPGAAARWKERLGRDLRDPEVVAAYLLRLAARRNPGGVVLFSTIRTRHVSSAVRAIADGDAITSESLDAFVGLLDSELGSRQAQHEG